MKLRSRIILSVVLAVSMLIVGCLKTTFSSQPPEAKAITGTGQTFIKEPAGLDNTPSAGPKTAASTAGTQETEPSFIAVFRVYELTLQAGSPGSKPYLNGPSVSASFRGTSGAASGEIITVKGFWDGDNVWKIRFAPTATGDWTFETSSSDPGLDGVTGNLTAISPTADELDSNPLNHGFLEADGYAWRLSDGTPFLPVGDTQWSFSEEITTNEWERWMSARQAQGFNSFLGTVWLAKYDRAAATSPPFPDKDPKTEDLKVAFFQRLDKLIQFANDHGIIIGLSIGGFPADSDWFQRFGDQERNDRWFRYVVNRYSAYNVRWVLYGEVNEKNPPWGTTWEEEIIHSAQLVKEEDPYDHPIGSHHNSFDESSVGNPIIDYIEVQVPRTEFQYQVALDLRRYGKPIWFEEYWYEPKEYDHDVELGIRNTHRSFIAAMAFPTMGSLMRAHYPNFDIKQVEKDPGALRMCYFVKFYRNLDLYDFSPEPDLIREGPSGRFGDDYAIFLKGGGDVKVDMGDKSGVFAVRVLDINTGVANNLGQINGDGIVSIETAIRGDVAILLIRDRSAADSDIPGSIGRQLNLSGEELSFQASFSLFAPFVYEHFFAASASCNP